MNIAGMDVRPGTTKRGFLETPGFVDGIRLRIPVVVSRGAKRGKTLVVLAGQHGREVNGPAAIYRAMKTLRPKHMCGIIVFVPAVNHLAMRQHKQNFPFEGRRCFRNQPSDDMFNVNRNWPGDPKGTFAERLTHTVYQAAVKRADAVIDLHSWSDRFTGLAFTAKRNVAYLRAFGYPFSHFAQAPGQRGRLLGTCYRDKRPSITCEITPQNVVNPTGVRWACQGILNVARFMGILRGDPEFPWPRYELATDGVVNVTAQTTGLVVPTHEVGDVVEAGEIAVELVDLETFKPLQVVRASERMILRRHGCPSSEGRPAYHLAYPGDAFATLTPIKREWAAGEKPA